MSSPLCKGNKADGTPCGAPALANSDYCRHHVPPEPEKDVECGHENKHHLGPAPLRCDLPKGHAGLHSAVYHATDYKSGGVVWEGDKRTYWSDAAGVPLPQ